MVIFDKTGTLTRGSPAVSEVAAAPGTSEDELVAYSAAVESNSEHPLAKAILAEAARRNLTQLPATNFEALSGRGARALVEGKSIAVGGPRLLTEANVAVPPAVKKLTTAWASDGKTVLYAVADARLLGAFAVEDEIRPESSEAVAALHRLGVRVAMITGARKRLPTRSLGGSESMKSQPKFSPPTRLWRWSGFRPAAGVSRWSATASTTHQHWRRQT
jgi:Cu2+-exporting ATPase